MEFRSVVPLKDGRVSCVQNEREFQEKVQTLSDFTRPHFGPNEAESQCRCWIGFMAVLIQFRQTCTHMILICVDRLGTQFFFFSGLRMIQVTGDSFRFLDF